MIHSFETINSTSLRLQWYHLSKKHGKATEYRIRVQCLDCHELYAQPKLFSISARYNRTTVTGLRVYSRYSAEIAARNKFGDGSFSDPVFARTNESGRLWRTLFSTLYLFVKDTV